jgi:hypothetical protein
MDLKRRAFGFALGTMLGLLVFIGSCWLLIIDSESAFFSNFASFFFGYSFTFIGAFVGLFWGFVYGFFFGGLLAWLYNIFSRMIYSNR